MRYFIFFLFILNLNFNNSFGYNRIYKKNEQQRAYQYFSENDRFSVTLHKKNLILIDLKDNSIKFDYENKYGFNQDVLFLENSVYFTTKDGTIQSRDSSNGKLNWYFDHEHSNQKYSPRIYFYKNNLLVFYGDGEFFNLDKNNGRILRNENIFKKHNFKKNYGLIFDFKDGELILLIKNKKKREIFEKIFLKDEEILTVKNFL
jgi:outer membrane protein assembly factor BamB